MSFFLRIGISLIVLTALNSRATMQRLEATVEAPRLSLLLTEDAPVTFWERFEFSFESRAERIFTDRLHSLNTMNWHFELAGRAAEDFRESSAHAASRALSRSLAVSLREATFDLPLLVWLRENRGFFADLVLNSMDAYGEEAVDPLNPSYRPLERSWWRAVADSRSFSYGLRPLSSESVCLHQLRHLAWRLPPDVGPCAVPLSSLFRASI